MPPDRYLLGDESQMLAIMRAHYGEPHTCEGTCSRYQRERLLSLRDRLHESLHVGDPTMWRCTQWDGMCPLLKPRGVVDKLTEVVSEWLREQDDTLIVDVIGWLATEARR